MKNITKIPWDGPLEIIIGWPTGGEETSGGTSEQGDLGN